ncbi:MAG: hypothetical protein D6767_02285 [Candidatus Hydrogenedentota bacterium]|nr:MAG: hypothetical protein D6767_02285 [Candidatus Hydrogenedentota bacterium]
MRVNKKIVGFTLLCFVGILSAKALLDNNTVALLDGKERVSKKYFLDIRDRIRKDPVEIYMRRKAPGKNFNAQVLRIIAGNYIQWKEAKKLGYHHKRKFKQRFLAALQGFFAEYIGRKLVEKNILKREEAYNHEKLSEYLINLYKVQIDVANIDDKVFAVQRKSPDLKLYGKLPKAKFTPTSRFNKKLAEKYIVVSYRKPGDKKRTKLNLRYILERMPTYDFYRFRTANAIDRHEILKAMIAGDLIPLEFKRLSKNDPYAKEYVRRIEQVTLARFYRMMKGVDPASDYALSLEEKDLMPVNLTEKEMREYFEKNKGGFLRPKQTEAYILRLTRKEVDEGDEFLEMLKDLEEPYQVLRNQIMNLQDERARYVALRRHAKDKKKKELDRKIKALNQKIKKLLKKSKKVAKEVAQRKLAMFKKKIDEVNRRPDRVSGEVRKSGYYGKITFDANKDMKRYEVIAFTVPMEPYGGKESILFNSGEGDYVILYVFNTKKQAPDFYDPIVQKRIRYHLELRKRREAINKMIREQLPKVLPRKYVNWDLLRRL